MSLALDGDGDAAVESAVSALQVRRALRRVFGIRTGDHEVAAILSFSRQSAEHLLRLQRSVEAEDDPGRIVKSTDVRQ